MKDHEKRNLVTDLCAIAVQCRDSESLRDRIAHRVLQALDAAVAAERADERERSAITVWMTLQEALADDADDKGLDGWMREAEQRVRKG